MIDSFTVIIHRRTSKRLSLPLQMNQKEKANSLSSLSSYITKSFPFDSSVSNVKEHLKSLYASGGGDGPEGVTAGMKAALELDWRQNAAKMAVLIADAPCHGIGEYGDGFPDRSHDGEDPLLIARQMAQMGIPLVSAHYLFRGLSRVLTRYECCHLQFVVACEPALSGYQFGLDFFRGEF